MGNRITGLDIGPGGVKAVQITAELSGKIMITAMEDYVARTMEDVDAALGRIRQDERFRRDTFITALPASAFSFRNIRMPFRETRKIRQTLNFELEPLIPYPIEEVVTDFVVVERASAPEATPPEAAVFVSDVLAAAVPKETVRQRIESLESLRVALIDVEAVPTALNLIAAGYDREFYILLDVGTRETVAVFFRQGKIFQVRSFAFGGDAVTAAARSSEADADDAEAGEKKGDSAAGGEEIAAACGKFFAELDYTLEYMGLRNSGEPLAKIIVTGDGEPPEPFNSALAGYFSVPVEKLDLRTIRNISLPVKEAGRWNPLRMNNALALALHGLQKGRGGLNFRREEFTGGGYVLAIRENFRRIAAAALIILGILAFDSVAGYFIDQLRLANLKTEIAAILKKSSPEITRIVDPVQQLRTKVVEAKKFTGVSGAGALELLRKISEAVPPSDNLLVSDLNFDGEKVEIRAETVDFDSVEKIKRDIAGSGFFRDVSISGANMVKDKNKVEFELRMDCAR